MPGTYPQPTNIPAYNPNTGSYVQGAGALIGAGLGAYTSISNTNKTIAANKEQAKYAYSKDLEMWNRMNAYNTPAMQMQRLKAAGLNPNLVYGSGTKTGNTQQMPKYNAPRIDYNYQVPPLTGVLTAYQDYNMKNAQVDNIRAHENQMVQETANKVIQGALLRTTLGQKKFDLQLDQDTRKYQFQYRQGVGRASSQKAWNLMQINKLDAKRIELLNQQIQNAIEENKRRSTGIDKAPYWAQIAGKKWMTTKNWFKENMKIKNPRDWKFNYKHD